MAESVNAMNQAIEATTIQTGKYLAFTLEEETYGIGKVVQQNAANAEESAAASEEMNAQAEQLRDYVGELMMMVAGKKDQTVTTTTGETRTIKPVSHHLSTADFKNNKMLGHDAKEIRPDQVIPFDDDDDFKNF